MRAIGTAGCVRWKKKNKKKSRGGGQDHNSQYQKDSHMDIPLWVLEADTIFAGHLYSSSYERTKFVFIVGNSTNGYFGSSFSCKEPGVPEKHVFKEMRGDLEKALH